MCDVGGWLARSALALALTGVGACSGDGGDSGGGGRGGTGSQTPFGGSGGTPAGGANAGVGAGSFGNPTGMTPIGGGSGVASPISMGNECAEGMVHTTKTEPTIYFVIDGSGSMCDAFGGSTRWQALRTALLDPTMGVIYQLQSIASFGMRIYDGTIDPFLAALSIGGQVPSQCAGMYLDMKMTGECPLIIDVPAALDNAAMLDAAYPMTELGGSTPTDKALGPLVDKLISEQVNVPDLEASPQYIILATDGAPNDICMGGMGGDGIAQQQAVLAAVDRAAQAKIKTFVISLAGNDANLQAHLDQVADHGDPNNPDAHTFNPTTPEDLVKDIVDIVGGAVGCDILLDGRGVMQGKECLGTVTMNGVELPCCREEAGGGFLCDNQPMPDPDGWRLKDPTTMELVGQTCLDFLAASEAIVLANFPCDVYIE